MQDFVKAIGNAAVGYMAIVQLPNKRTVSVTAEYTKEVLDMVLSDLRKQYQGLEIVKIDTSDRIKAMLGQ